MNISELARQAGGLDMTINGYTTFVGTQTTEFLERFAALIREECAKKCEELANAKVARWEPLDNEELMNTAKASAWDYLQCAATIRGMGDE